MRLEQLDEDILCFILCICDVYTVLSMSQVNRSFKRIADSKHIWICLIADLAARGLIDLPHDCPFREFSSAQLREEIKRIVLGPQTWSCPSRSSPIVSREFRIPGDSPPPRLQLLLGGTHLIVEHTSRIELWHIATSAVIWSCVHTESFFWRRCVAELGDKRFVILLSVDPHVLRIIHIDLDTGHSAELFRIEPPQGAEFLNEPLLSGDFFLCELTWWYAQSYRLFMVGNWRTWTHTVLRYEPTLGLDSWLVGASLFFFTSTDLPTAFRRFR
ncbi:hypothetical protein C8J57DRAFT_1280964 [Mycena rebaudengoi]|nr:hypothetical protein C8J57DRAFT_1280964 [Mycena rebaudengoi]